MYHRGVTTGMMGHRIAAGNRQQPRNECAPHRANRGTAQGFGTAVPVAVVHGRITDKLRFHALEMHVSKRLASLARASKVIDGVRPALCAGGRCVGFSGGRAVLGCACQVSVLDWLGHWPVTARVRSSGWVDAS
jgi:hypothetical protein